MPSTSKLHSLYTSPSPEASKDIYDKCPVHTIWTKFRVPTNRCPFNTAEAPRWTAVERDKAVNAVPVASLLELEKTVGNCHSI